MKNKLISGRMFRSIASIKTLLLVTIFCFAGLASLSAQTIKTVGTGGDYLTLKDAITYVNTIATPTAVELQIISDVTETASAVTISWNTNLTSLKIYPTGGSWTITAFTLSLLTISNANVTIDGSLGGTGTGPASLFIRPNPATTMANNANLITIGGAANKVAINVVVKYCNIFNFSNGFMLNSLCGVTLDHNSFYNNLSAATNGLAQQNCIIMPAGALFSNMDITNNYFGGSAPLATGTWVRDNTVIGSGASNWGFYGMYLRAGIGTPSAITHRITGNVIRNVTSQTSTQASGRGIYGIYFRQANAGKWDITGNTISDMTYESDASNAATAERYLTGIWINGTGTINFSNNEIFNFDNRGVQTTNNNPITAGVVIGGNWDSGTAKGTLTINNNNIHNIKSLNIYNGGISGNVPANVNITAGIIGVLAHNGITIDGNKAYNISNYNSGAYASPVVGIQVKASVDAGLTLNNIRNNTVYGISSASTQPTATAPYIIGLGITGGNANCYNNAVSIGDNAQGGAVVGILKYTDAATSNSTFYHNSVYVGGAVALTSSERSSFAFLRLGAFNPGTSDVLKNNIFYNARSGSLNHFAIGLLTGFTTGFTSDYNELYSGTAANLGTVTATEANSAPTPLDFAGWQTAVSGDPSSKNAIVAFADPALANLRTGAPQLGGAGTSGLGITTDILGVTRPTPPSIGAYEVFSVTGITVFGQGGVSNISLPGGTLQMQTRVLPLNASDSSIVWSVADGTGHGTISPAGLLTASSSGTVTVTANAHDLGGVSGQATILLGTYVSSIAVTSEGGATTISVDGVTLQLSADVQPLDAYNRNVTWSIVSGLAIINSSGLLIPRGNGPVVARATATDGSGVYGEFTVTLSNQILKYVSSIAVSGIRGDSIAVAGDTLQMKADILPLNAWVQTVTWSITNLTGQATLSSAGLLTPISNGIVRVTATANDGTGVIGQKDIKITNQLPATITVANDAQTASNAVGQVVKAQAGETPGRIYLVYSSAPQANIFELEASRKQHKAAFGVISAINTDVLIPTDSLIPGTYNVYATDLTYNRSVNASSNTINITDGLAPVVSYPVQTVSNGAGKTVKVQSSETGKVYIILDGVPQASLANLDTAVANHNGARAQVVVAQMDVSINVSNLTPGTYYAYGIDDLNNLSSKFSTAITITDGIAPIVAANAQDQKNGTGGTVYAQSNEPTGKVYIILDSLVRTNITVTSLDSIVALLKGASGQVTAANTDMPIVTYGIKPGKYFAYTADASNNISQAGANIIKITDGIPPLVSLAKPVTISNAPGQFINLRSNETPSRLFLILDGSLFSSYSDLQAIVANGNGAMTLSMVNDSVPVPTNGLNPGTYYAYAVDDDGNISPKSINPIIVTGSTGTHTLWSGKLNIYTSGSDIVLDISAEIPQDASAEVFDLLGHKVGVYLLHQGVNTISASVKGICIVKACMGKQVEVIKLLLP